MASQASGANAPRRGGRTAGAEGYSSADVRALLTCIRIIKPISGNDWDRVLVLYQETHATPNDRAQRNTNSIKTKFNGLIGNTKKTGNPHCPQQVKDAKAIQREIEEKTHLLRINDDSDDEDRPHESGDEDDHVDAPSPRATRPELIDFSCDGSGAESDEDVGGIEEVAVPENRIVVEPNAVPAPPTQATQPSRPRNDVNPAPAQRKASRGSTKSSGKRPNSDTMAEALQRHLYEQSNDRKASANERMLRLQLQIAKAENDADKGKRQRLREKLDRVEVELAALKEEKLSLRHDLLRREMEIANLREQQRYAPWHPPQWPQPNNHMARAQDPWERPLPVQRQWQDREPIRGRERNNNFSPVGFQRMMTSPGRSEAGSRYNDGSPGHALSG